MTHLVLKILSFISFVPFLPLTLVCIFSSWPIFAEDETDQSKTHEEHSEESSSDSSSSSREFEDGSFENEFVIGYQGAIGLVENGVTRNRPYLFAHTTYNFPSSCHANTVYAFDLSLRSWYDLATTNWGQDIQARTLFFDITSEKWSLKSGFQEIAWGETFGLYPMDMVNPRDYTDPFFNELAWIRIPVFTFNAQLFYDPWTVQFVCTPIPLNNWLPDDDSPWNVVPAIYKDIPLLGPHKFAASRCGQDAEYGTKIGYLFENGFDLSLIYFHHWNRDPVYKLRFDDEDFLPFLKPELRLISSYGASFSKAFEAIVLRGDTVLHQKTPWTVDAFGIVRRRNLWRTILGMDISSEDKLTVGFQYHCDHWREATLHSFSVRFMKELFKGKLLIECFAYQGINNRDQWIQPQITWFACETWEISLRGDFLNGHVNKYGTPTAGFIGPYRNKDRLFVWAKRHF